MFNYLTAGSAAVEIVSPLCKKSLPETPDTMAEELVTGPEGLIVFQGAESLQVRAALRAAKRPIRNRYTYTQALTRAKDIEKTWMEGQGRDHKWGSHTHARECHRVSVHLWLSPLGE